MSDELKWLSGLWFIWVMLAGVGFFTLCLKLQTIETSVVAYLPSSVWLYLGVTSVIALGNWVFGWLVMYSNN